LLLLLAGDMMMVIGPFIAFLVFILSIVILIGFSAICKRGQDYQLAEKPNGKDQQENQNSKLVK
jgi:Na+-transporting methylmalonyl-CoA/oxaloacetate decarboxylase gamma subunit